MPQEKTNDEQKKFRIPPIAVVIAAAVAALVCVIILIAVADPSRQDEMFKEDYGQAEASCLNKTILTDDSGVTYLIDIEFTAQTADGEFPFTVRMTENDPRLDETDVGDKIDIYYKKSDPSYCHPTLIYPDHTAVYVILTVIIILCIVIIVLNVNTILRNIHGYTPKFEKPDDIGFMGNAGAETGLDDKQIDYAAGDVFSNNVMDSYADPFATYTGYEEEEN